MIDEIDKAILQKLQDRFPLIENPWEGIGVEVNLSGEETLRRIRRLYERKIIKKIGAIINSRRLGIKASTLIAARIPQEKIDEVSEKVNSFKEVTHSYLRKHEYNLWFTVLAENKNNLEKLVTEIVRASGITDFLDLRTLRVFKIDLKYRFTDSMDPTSGANINIERIKQLHAGEINVLRQLHSGLPLENKPFQKIAKELNMEANEVLNIVDSLVKTGVIRRLGVAINPEKLGIVHVMIAWKIRGEVPKIAEKLSEHIEVSHCVERKTIPGKWEYNLYTVIYGKNRNDCVKFTQRFAYKTEIIDYVLLFSERELKHEHWCP